jgi:hypothetical protein
MGFRNHREINDAFTAGKYRVFSFRKVPTQTTASGIWFDLSMSPGNPVPNYYAATPLTSKRLAQSSDGGLFHAGMSSPVTVTFGSTDATGILMTTPSDYPSYTKFRLSTTGSLPTGLAVDTDYYSIRVSATTSRIATSQFNAEQGIFIPYDVVLGSLGSGTQKLLELPNSVEYLYRLSAISLTTTAVPLPAILCDYLLYYPFVDMSVTDAQPMIVGETLSRYADGDGVQMMAVEVATQVGGVSFNVTYTNSDGVAGRVSRTVTCNTQISIGTIITTAQATAGCAGPFIPLQSGDTGVRSIESITFLSGDVGLITLVLVKPLATLGIYDITGPSEKDFLTHTPGSLPVIKDDAYLNLIVYPVGTLASAPIFGTIETVFT